MRRQREPSFHVHDSSNNSDIANDTSLQRRWNIAEHTRDDPVEFNDGALYVERNCNRERTGHEGNVAMQFTGGTAGASYNAQFCQFPYVPSPNQCFSIATITADASGAAKLSMKFPKSGTWGSGTFFLQSSSDFFDTASATLDGTAMFQVVPASGANQTLASSLPQDPLSSGTVNVANKTVTITVKGASPNSSYDVTECGSPTACFPQSALMTDASGNGSVSFAVPFRPASEFEIVRQSGGSPVASGFLSGFKVP